MDLLNDFNAYLVNLNSSESINNEECSKFAKGIIDKKIQLVQLVEKLGPFLIDTNHDKREQGCLVLATVLALLPYKALSSTEIDFISDFLCERMKDHHSVVPAALKGTLAVAQMKNVNDGIASKFFSVASMHFYCQSQRQDDRNTYYRIICRFIDTKKPELLQMGTDFVYGVISSIDGEKDPRNLMLIFSKLVPKFVSQFNLGHLVEEMFEVIACYFPVDFQPLSDDPQAITRENLASALQPCLVASPDFAQFTIPLTLEKLVSDLHLAKVDALKLLVESCKKFPVPNLTEHVTTVWHTLRSQLLVCVGDTELRDLCLKALKTLVQKLSCSALDQQQSSIYTGLLRDIIATVRGYLSDLSLSLFNPICKLLENVASASFSSCNFFMSKVVPIFMALTPKTPSESVTLLKAVSSFLNVCFDAQVLPSELSQLGDDYGKLVSLYFSSLSSNNTDVALEGAKGVIIILPLLSAEKKTTLYGILGSLLKQDVDGDFRSQLYKCLKACVTQNPEEVMEKLVLSDLQLNHDADPIVIERCLTVWCYLADQEPFFSHLMSHIKSVVESNSEENLRIFLACFKNLIEVENLVLPNGYIIVSYLLTGLLQSDCKDDNFFKLLEDSFHVINSITINLNESDELSLAKRFLPEFINSIEQETGESESIKIRKLYLLSSLLTRSKVQIDETSLLLILQFCINLLFLPVNKSIALHSARFIAILINKIPSDSDIAEKSEKIQSFINERITLENSNLEISLNLTCLTGWLVKALISRNHPSADFWINALMNLLADTNDSIRLEAAEMFQTIVSDDPFFSLGSHCIIKILYRQRLFQYVPKLVENSKNTDFKTSYLMAVLYQLCNIPCQVIIMYLAQVLPVLLETIKTDSLEQLQLPALKIISTLLQAKSEVLQPHLGTFIASLLRLAKSSPQMKIRISALQCLFDCSQFEESVVLPHKSTVLQELMGCLGDKKRLVRREAVRTRSRWFFIGSPVG